MTGKQFNILSSTVLDYHVMYDFHSYDCDDREAEDDELNGNDEDEESGEEAPDNDEGTFNLRHSHSHNPSQLVFI